MLWDLRRDLPVKDQTARRRLLLLFVLVLIVDILLLAFVAFL